MYPWNLCCQGCRCKGIRNGKSMRHPLLMKLVFIFSKTVWKLCPFAFGSSDFFSESVQRSDLRHLSNPHSTPRWLRPTSAALIFLCSYKGRISLLRLSIGQFRLYYFIFYFFFGQSNLCIKWQYTNQVTLKGGRLGHFSEPGEGVLKQKDAPGF